MSVFKLRIAKKGPRTQVPGVLSRPEFEQALECECMRANRIGLPLSMVVISWPEKAATATMPRMPQEVMVQAARLAASRVRCTDVVGWLYDGAIGMLLPHTHPASAWHLADELHLRLEAIVRDKSLTDGLDYAVYSCPFEGQVGNAYYRQTSLFRGYCPNRARSAGYVQSYQ